MDHVISSLLDGLSDLWIHSVSGVHDSGSLLDDTEGLDERRRQTLGRPADIEILE